MSNLKLSSKYNNKLLLEIKINFKMKEYTFIFIKKNMIHINYLL